MSKQIEGLKLEVPGAELKKLIVDSANRYRALAEKADEKATRLKKADEMMGSAAPHRHHFDPNETMASSFSAFARNFDTMAKFVDEDAVYVLSPVDFQELTMAQLGGPMRGIAGQLLGI